MKSLFLSCDGYFNTAIVKNDLISDGNGLDLFIDGEFLRMLDVSDVKEHSVLMNINQIVDAGFESGIDCWQYDRIQTNGASTGLDLTENGLCSMAILCTFIKK